MAKKIYPITKFRFVAVVVSVLLLLVGLVSYIAFGGFNLESISRVVSHSASRSLQPQSPSSMVVRIPSH